MWLQVNVRSSVPVYQQIVDGVKAKIAKRALGPGDKMPSIRDLAVDLVINHNTIAKAYQELEREHVIEVIRGRGTFVTMNPSIPNRDERTQEIRKTLGQLLVEAHHLHMSEQELIALLHDVIDEWHQEDLRRK